MRKLDLLPIFLSILLVGCNSKTSKLSSEVQAKTLSESEKLAYRQSKWNADLKCLKALKIDSDRLNALCANSNNIYSFAKDGDLQYAFTIVKLQLEILDTYQEELENELRGTLPEDKLDVSSIELSLIFDRKEKILELNNEKYDKTMLCIDRAALGEVDYDFCKMDVENIYQTQEQNTNNKFDKIELAVNNFKENYTPLP